MINFLKKKPEFLLPIVAIIPLLGSLIADIDLLILYGIYGISMTAFMVISRRKMDKRRLDLEDRQWKFIENYRNNGVVVRFFVPTKSDHIIVNWWRRWTGTHILKQYVGTYFEDNHITSYVSYVLTDKELFQVKLKGYFNTEDYNIAKQAINDSWMIERSRMK